MAFFGFFRRRPPIRSLDALADFIDGHAAFLIQRGIYEYSRARAGPFSKALLTEKAFLDLADDSRWRAFPIGLAMVAELVDGVLHKHVDNRRQVLEPLIDMVLSVFDRYPVPASVGYGAWSQIRATLENRLQLIGLHARKRVIDIPEPLAEAYFELMPIHQSLRGRDFPTIRNYLRIALCNIHDEFVQRVDAEQMATLLSVQGAEAAQEPDGR